MIIQEQNAIRKPWSKDKLKIALLYPNTYRVAITSLGVQLLYFLFNKWEGIICERVFKPIDRNILPYSLENQKPLSAFDIVAISCQFENDYVEAMKLLDKAKIKLDARERSDHDPLIILGGPSVTANPFPVLFFADAFFLGDLEPVEEQFIDAICRETKKERLEALSSVSGVMVLNYHYDWEGKWIGEKIRSNKISHMQLFYPVKQIIPLNTENTKNHPIFGKAFYLEVSRGCSERCSFCMVGNCRFPRADRTLDQLINLFELAKEYNDFDRVIIYGSSIGKEQRIDELIEYIVESGYEVSCPSIRADFLTENFLKLLKKGRQRTITLAPETGDEELRLAINKNMTDNEIFESVKIAWETGFRNLKLYLMYGFPFEKEQTKVKTVEFIRKIRKNYFKTGKISISLNQMITKAATPFQFASMMSLKASKKMQQYYRKEFYKLPNISVSLFTPEWAAVQRILSLRGKDYYKIVEAVGHIGNTIGNWKKVLKASEKTLEGELSWNYNYDDTLPWDNIRHKLSKRVLYNAFLKYCESYGCNEPIS